MLLQHTFVGQVKSCRSIRSFQKIRFVSIFNSDSASSYVFSAFWTFAHFLQHPSFISNTFWTLLQKTLGVGAGAKLSPK
jgi:hypothetical protein